MKRLAVLFLLIAVPLAALGPGERRPPAKWALIVGISDYIHLGDEPGGDLPGAERDARNYRDVLVGRWGVPAENVKMLLNHEATRNAIQEALTEWLPSVAQAGDLVIFAFAGHGSQMWDENGDEEDGLDETLVPADARPETTEFDISDDEIGEWLSRLPTPNVVVIYDQCNSGTATRAATPFSRARFLKRDLSRIPRPEGMTRRALPGQEDPSGIVAGAGGIVELAAAQPDQVAVDALFEDPAGEPYYAGAFSTFLIRQLWLAPPGASYREVFEAARDALKRARFQQDPMISGAQAEAPAFALEGEAGGAPTIPVLHASGDVVELAGGRLLGITEGSLLEVEGGARLLVESVTPERAMARVVSGRVPPGENPRARFVAYRFPETQLRVNVAGIDARTREGLAAALQGTAGVVLVEDEDAFAHLLVRRTADSVRVLGLDGYTRHAFAGGAGAAAELAGAIRKEAASKRLAEMENMAPPFQVEVWLAGGRKQFGIGEEVTFHVRSERDGHLTLVDLGTDGTVTVLFPNPYAPDNRIRAGETMTFPPPEAEFMVAAQPPPGQGLVRAFVTAEPLDVGMEPQEAAADNVAFARRLAEALVAAAGREPDAPGAVPLEGWATAAVVYEIVR